MSNSMKMQSWASLVITLGDRTTKRLSATWITLQRFVADQYAQIGFQRLYTKYKSFSMIPKHIFVENLSLCHKQTVEGCVIECGTWRGGMIAAIAEVMGASRYYYLFDSFEGLPPVRDVDGPAARAWQADTLSPYYFDNCRTEVEFAERAMQLSGAKQYSIVKGWFSETLASFVPSQPIAVLRLDGDWYDSTIQCLSTLYRYVATNGMIIIDDYYVWDGCAKAVHDFLSTNRLVERICQSRQGVAYLIKRS